MKVTLGGRDWELLAGPGATVADLAAAVGVDPASLGHRPGEALAAVPVLQGAVLDRPRAAADGAVVVAAVVGGLDAGRRVPLRPGRWAVGRSPASAVATTNPTVSRRHAELAVAADGSVTIRDLGSRNGTWLDGTAVPPGQPVPLPPGATARLGAADLAVGPVAATDEPVARAPSPAGTVAFNRPPRPAPPPPPAAVPVPDPPPPPTGGVPLGVVTVLGPVAMAAVLVVVLGNPLFAVLALLSPIMAVGNHLEGRRRTRQAERANRAQREADLAALAEGLAAAGAAERARREAGAPDLAEVLRRAEQPSTRLWERRRGHPDFLRLRVGTADVGWEPPLDGDRHPRPADAAEVIEAASVLPACAATVDLDAGGAVGVVGPRPAALAVARSLVCQAAVHHGPADLPVAVACTEDAAEDWDWVKWLPHVEDEDVGERRLAAGREAADALAAALAGSSPLVVVDGDGLLDGRRAPLRTLLAGPAVGVVVAVSADRLPASCTAVVVVDDDGVGELVLPAQGTRLATLRACGLGPDTAERCARALARFDDPELAVPGSGLPDGVRLLSLLGLESPSPDAVTARWRSAPPRPVVPVGVDAHGVVEIDLVADGPHALVAGTTGAGKSELLRTLVAGLAAGSDPAHVTFVLVDFKGGSAFDACARLPHVVGVVTDLDDDLAQRALRCLEAELRHRERLLREAGVADLADAPGLVPRLVVVVDEFATLKAELPGFVDALVGVAQRGRSLGVHLVLATQRPSGAVSDHIRANTNLRVALRVQDVADSTDVVDVPDAAHLPRRRPGRACLRLGPGEVTVLQAALVSGRAPVGGGAAGRVRAVPFRFGPGAGTVDVDPPSGSHDAAGPSDLERLVDACAQAWAGRPAPRRPWPDPLPEQLDRSALPAGALALADDPDGQRQLGTGWRPEDGNLTVYGVGGSGTTTTLVAAAVALAETQPPDRLHLYGIDHGAGGLDVLAGLPHTGAVVAATDRERQQRLVRRLREELDRRRGLGAGERGDEPSVVVLVDGIGGFLDAFDDVVGLEVLDAFERVFADGPAVGIHVAVAADRPGALPSALAAVVRQRWVHRLADPLDAGAAGVTGRLPSLPPGRFVDVTTALVAQVGVPAEGWPAAVARCAERWAGVAPTAAPVGVLPRRVAAGALGVAASFEARPWTLPVGIAEDDLGVVELPLWEGDHVLVAGPGRSGRTTALGAIGCAAQAAGARVVAVAGRRPLGHGFDEVPVRALATRIVDDGTPTVVLVDDAEALDDAGRTLAALVAAPPPSVHVVAAARADVLRGLYDHWLRAVRRSRLGLLLTPHVDLDGELLGATLPRRVAVPMVPGRGFLVADGVPRLVQVAEPT